MLAITIGALAFTPTSVVQPRSVVVQMRTGPPSMNFFDDMQTNFKKMMQQPPSLDEAVELCRDDESTGCTLEMLDIIEKSGTKKDDKAPQYRWSQAIDDAVVKPE